MEKQNKQKEQRPHPCPFCLGTGKSLKELTRHYVENILIGVSCTMVKCRSCNGSGVVWV